MEGLDTLTTQVQKTLNNNLVSFPLTFISFYFPLLSLLFSLPPPFFSLFYGSGDQT